MNRAEPFVMAALAGLCAHPRVHNPEEVAKQAVEIGVATARAMAALERAEDEAHPMPSETPRKGRKG